MATEQRPAADAAAARVDSFTTPEFSKTSKPNNSRKQSALTQLLSASSDNNTSDEADYGAAPTPRRGLSVTSTWSNPSLTSDNGMTSPGTRTNTPSPPPPANIAALPPSFNTKLFSAQPVVIKDHDSVDPLDKTVAPAAGEQAVEAGLGRKRCIMFACGKKATPAPEKAEVEVKPAVEQPPKRKCMLSFACPTKAEKASTEPVRKPSIGRRPSPAPTVIKVDRSDDSPSRHQRRTSNSPNQSASKSMRRASSVTRTRRLSTAGEDDTAPTQHFIEYAGQRTEDDDWMKERTCHRSRLTVNDTLKVELDLSKLGKEAEEEEEVEEEDELDEEGVVDSEEDDVEVDQVGPAKRRAAAGDGVESDDGFDSDDEAGMDDSSEDDDAGSDYEWWTPGRSTAATSYEHLDQLHFTRQRNMSGSSIGSATDTRPGTNEKRKVPKKRASISIRKPEPDLPDSTDFVCGTLDEDRPMEEAFKQEIEKRRAAKHVPCPQDIDPTFPTSDPDMDEEDDDDVFQNHEISESDAHMDGVFGNFEAHEDPTSKKTPTMRGRPRRSPAPSPPKRLRSPPPTKRATAVHRSPPPPSSRRLFGQSPKRHRSPVPGAVARLRSPPPTRRTSSARLAPLTSVPVVNVASAHPIALAERPQHNRQYASSLPRRPNLLQRHRAPSTNLSEADAADDDATRAPHPARGAIDIVKGLEKKRQFRREKLYQKYCRARANGEVARKEERRCQPGKGAERMREMGLELAGRMRGGKRECPNAGANGAEHILSL